MTKAVVSPGNWFRRTGNALSGLSSIGIKEIQKNKVKTLSLPSEIDGHKIDRLVFDCLTCLKDVPEIEELIIPGDLKIQGLTSSGKMCLDFPNSETIKRLVFTGETNINFYSHVRTFDESIESITIQDNDRFASEDGVIFSKDKSRLVFYPRSKKDKKYIVPESVTGLWDSSFRNAKAIEEVVLPEGLESIAENAFRESGIRRIEVPGTVSTIWKNAFAFCNLESVILHRGLSWIDKEAFLKCTAKEIIFPETMNRIGENAFYESTTKFVFHSDSIILEKNAFANCSYLQFIGTSRAMRFKIVKSSFEEESYNVSDPDTIRIDAVNRIKILCGENYLIDVNMAPAKLEILFLRLLDEIQKENISKDQDKCSEEQKKPAFGSEQMEKNLLQVVRSSDLIAFGEDINCINSISDELADSFLARIKNEHNRRATLDAGEFCPIMDRVPMTPKLFEIYEYIADFKNWDYSLPTDHVHRIRRSISKFELYRMTGYKGEVQRDAAYDVGCYITGPMPSRFLITEDEAREWLTEQIIDAIQNGKRLFITKTSIGICCLAGEIVLELQKQYPDIKLVLILGKEYEMEDTGISHWHPLMHQIVYEQQPTKESLLWIPRLKNVKEKANLIYSPLGEREHGSGERIDFPVWIPAHCRRIITTWKDYELSSRLLYQADKEGVEIITYEKGCL